MEIHWRKRTVSSLNHKAGGQKGPAPILSSAPVAYVQLFNRLHPSHVPSFGAMVKPGAMSPS
eukprot:1158466-Pelagomonas_calceolata.AAC.2